MLTSHLVQATFILAAHRTTNVIPLNSLFTLSTTAMLVMNEARSLTFLSFPDDTPATSACTILKASQATPTIGAMGTGFNKHRRV
ncbi:hypothetical protein BELL_0380g00090 [Botrytis elliptica]|uniref:Uncharacterized protein n=1 Tax=Botrytis elliptica TaxID=278938 RepID=A0A4Z1JI81_9HELO|nr:hypothetical protein BELL_0380g00090 [Botrytis elliptica]